MKVCIALLLNQEELKKFRRLWMHVTIMTGYRLITCNRLTGPLVTGQDIVAIFLRSLNLYIFVCVLYYVMETRYASPFNLS